MFSPENLLAYLLFGAIGMGAFGYGKATEKLRPLLIGLALMLYPYLYSDTWYLWGAGALLTTALVMWREA